MRFEFATATRIVFGRGTRAELGALAAELGRKALVVTGRDANRAQGVLEQLRARGIETTVFAITGEPVTDEIVRGIAQARMSGRDLVIGIGGGAVIDSAKAIAGMLTNEGSLFDYLEVIGSGRPLARPGAPFIAIPTTAGTGAEVTRNAVFASPTHRLKVSLRSAYLLPRVALVDSVLTHDLPAALTASTGLDALTQLIEPYVCTRATPLTEGFCEEGMRRVARSLRRAVDDGSDADARDDMALASLLGGLALANAGLGAVHGFASPIGGMFLAPHGAVCGALLPFVMEANVAALRRRVPGSGALNRYDVVARLLTGNMHAKTDDGVRWVQALVASLRIPPLRSYGVAADDLSAIVAAAEKASSMKANPVTLTADELNAILVQAL